MCVARTAAAGTLKPGPGLGNALRDCREVLLIWIDHDGTGRGYDLELLEEVIAAVNVSGIASKGAGACGRLPDGAPPGAGKAALAKGPRP